MDQSLLLTPDEARTLANARKVLKSVEDRLWYRDEETGTAGEALRCGRVAEAAEAAEKAVFHVLNVSSSYLGDEIAGRNLRRPE